MKSATKTGANTRVKYCQRHGFLLNKDRGGSRIFLTRWCTRLLLHFNTNKPHSFFFRIQVVLENRRSSRGGGAHPLHPPPRSAPEGALASMMATPAKTLLKKWNRVYSNFDAFIIICGKCHYMKCRRKRRIWKFRLLNLGHRYPATRASKIRCCFFFVWYRPSRLREILGRSFIRKCNTSFYSVFTRQSFLITTCVRVRLA